MLNVCFIAVSMLVAVPTGVLGLVVAIACFFYICSQLGLGVLKVVIFLSLATLLFCMIIMFFDETVKFLSFSSNAVTLIGVLYLSFFCVKILIRAFKRLVDATEK